MTWRLSGFTDEAGLAIVDQVEATREAGLGYLDLRGIGEHSIVNIPPEQARPVRAQLDEASIRVNMFGSPLGKIDISDDFAGEEDKLEHLARMAEVFDCHDVRVFSYFNKQGVDPMTWRDRCVERLGRLKDQAKGLGLRLWLENERWIYGDQCPEVRHLAEQLRDGEHFHCLFDFDNFNQTGDDCWANWQVLKPYIDGFHLKESTADGTHVPIDEGAGHVEAILTDALQSDWAGPLSMEPHLAHSEAVMATGAHGQQNQALSQLSLIEAYVYATKRARAMLERIGAKYE